ncbi:MAG: hypothetical protein H7328_06300 [Bdellovibrio sp.]|nr:hypothetical protein [Bdellovibrio sp.]
MDFNFKKIFFLKPEHGFSIVEVMIGTGLIMVVALGGMSLLTQLTKTSKTNEVSTYADDRIHEIIENIRQQPTTEIIQYVDDPSVLLKKGSLKMAWSTQVDAPEATCQDCPGRYGYVISPINQALGDLYLVTIIFTHKDWENSRQYEFVVSK